MVTNAAFFTLTHTADSLYAGIQVVDQTTLNMNQFGAVVNQDGSSPPYGNTHMLSTSLASTNAHGMVSSDPSLTFEANGTPQLDAVWRYLIGTPTHDQTGTGGGNAGGTLAINLGGLALALILFCGIF
jgi:hypothetical protein